MNDNGLLPAFLTHRQKEVLQLVTEDLTSKEIAGKLGITAKTVEFHKQLLRKKCGNVGTAGLVRLAIRKGWIEP
jgi:DNA-binding CsgD family transcriptional regulator